MRTIKTQIFKYSELCDSAKEKARQWWRDASAGDSYFAESVIDDATTIAGILGIEFDNARNAQNETAVYWSGFWSQGDGASFHGRYSYCKGAAKEIRTHAPNDAGLHAIADTLQSVQVRYFYSLHAQVSNGRLSNHYSHSGTMSISVECDRREVTRDDEETVTQALRDFANWIYRELEMAYEYEFSDDQIEENIKANGYEFTIDGDIS